MKKILPISLILVLVLALMIVPAFADTVYEALPNDEGGVNFPASSTPSAGIYDIEITFMDPVEQMTASLSDISLVDTGSSELRADFVFNDDNYRLLIYPGSGGASVELYYINPEPPHEEMPVVSLRMTLVSPAPIDPEPSVPGISPEEGGITAMVESVVSAIFAVFSAIGNWFVEFLPTLTAIFWTGEALTFLGVLAILGLGVSVIFLLISVIRRFLNFGR